MATSVFNLSAVDRIETDVKAILTQLAAQADAISALTKVLTDFVNALGGSDQPAIDAATTALRSLHDTISASVERDKAP